MAPLDKPPPPSEPEKSTQKAILKRMVDPSGPLVKYMQNRCVLALRRSSPWLQPTMAGALQLLPPEAYPDMPLSSLITRFVASTNNKTRCPIFCVRFAPDGRRVLTGDNSGGISVWNTQDFNYQQYLQSHNKAVRDIQFMHNGQFVLAADDTGAVKLSTANLKPLTDMKVHQLPVRAVSPSPTDQMFASCSDDNVTPLQVYNMASDGRTDVSTTYAGPNGHGGDVKCVDWHPVTSLLASCGRDAMIKLWDCRHSPDTAMLATLQGHKQAVNKVCWNVNGTWLASCSRDLTVKVWDVRHTKREMASWQGHTRDISSVAWHPIHLDMLASAGGDGSVMFWMVGQTECLTKLESAHENLIHALAFHPMGHMMTTCAIDGVSKFWVRPRPGDPWKVSQQQEQEDITAMLAKVAAGGQQQLQLPGLLAAAGGAGGAGVGGVGVSAGPTTLPGGIPLAGPNHPGGVSPGMGGGGPAGRIPGIAGPPQRPMAMPQAAAAVPGLGPGIPGMPLARVPSGGPGMGMAAAGAGPGPGMMLPGLMQGVGGHQAGGMQPGMQGRGRGMMMAGHGAAAGAGGAGGLGGVGGRGRGRGAMQPYAGLKRPRDSSEGAGYEAGGPPAAAAAAGQQQGSWFPGAPKQQQHHHQHQHHAASQQPHQQPYQQQHHPQQEQQQHYQQHGGGVLHQQQQRPPAYGRGFGGGGGGGAPQGYGRGFGGGTDGGGRGAGGGRGPPHHLQGGRGSGDYGGGGGRGYGRGFGRGRH